MIFDDEQSEFDMNFVVVIIHNNNFVYSKDMAKKILPKMRGEPASFEKFSGLGRVTNASGRGEVRGVSL